MKIQSQRTDTGNTIICALIAILIISLIGANVLISCVTRYNVSAKQLKAWKEALYAAEAGGDIAFAEVCKVVSSPGAAFNGWTSPAASPAPTPGPSWSKGPFTFGDANSLSSSVTVDRLPSSPVGYRIRATGTAKLLSLPRAGMDGAFLAGGTNFKDVSVKTNRATARGVGDTLLRKIDYNYDHFTATYGDGDFNNASLQTVSSPQITRRIELVAVPSFLSFTGAIKVTGSFNGPGSAGVIDSYDSKNPASPSNPGGGSYYGSNPANPTYFADAHDGDVSVATPNFVEGGPIYGDVTTNGGTVKHSNTQISGTIDNNVPFTIPPLTKPSGSDSWPAGPATYTIDGSSTNSSNPDQYMYSSSLGVASNLIINPAKNLLGQPMETYVTVLVNGNVNGSITINNHVNAKIWFTGNMSTKATQIQNLNVDNAVAWNPSKAGHLQFYGISPTDGSYQTIDIAPPGSVYATMYAPSGDMTQTGNPDWFGAIVAHIFGGNGNGGGNTGFHYDKELGSLNTIVTDYRIASYVEDIR